MKTIKKFSAVRRASDKVAKEMTKVGFTYSSSKGWEYCPKSEFKAKIRNQKEQEKKNEND